MKAWKVLIQFAVPVTAETYKEAREKVSLERLDYQVRDALPGTFKVLNARAMSPVGRKEAVPGPELPQDASVGLPRPEPQPVAYEASTGQLVVVPMGLDGSSTIQLPVPADSTSAAQTA